MLVHCFYFMLQETAESAGVRLGGKGEGHTERQLPGPRG